jgi:hypothetical protein
MLDPVAWLARRREPARLLLGTYRPVEVIMRGHPMKAIRQDLSMHRRCTELRLEGLPEAAVAPYVVERLSGHPAPDDLARVLHRRTDGHPLFMAETVDAWLAWDSSKAIGAKHMHCWRQFTAGSPRDSTPPTCSRQRRCLKGCRESGPHCFSGFEQG